MAITPLRRLLTMWRKKRSSGAAGLETAAPIEATDRA
jgi:hypothetical protein